MSRCIHVYPFVGRNHGGIPFTGVCPSRNPPEYERVFLELLPRNFYACTQTTSRESNRATRNTVKRHILSMSKLLQKHIRACLSRTLFDGYDLEQKKVGEALTQHAQYWEKDEVDPSVAAADVKKALALPSEVTALDRVEAAWYSLGEYFALNAKIERVFRYSRGRLKSGSAHILTAEPVAGLNPLEFKTKVAAALDIMLCPGCLPGRGGPKPWE